MENSTIDTQATESRIATLLENARQAISTGDYTGAERYADEVLALNEEHGNAYYWKGAALFGQKKYKKAVSSLTEAVVLYEFNTDYFSLLALAYFKSAQAEKAVLVADRGLALQADDLACLEVKTFSLIALFRLQEAHVTLQQVLQLKARAVISKQAAFVTDDIEALYEQALTIDPFKTKSRLENFNTVKLRNADYRTMLWVTAVNRSKTFVGFLVLISLITAVTYFFRDDATYKSFTFLLFVLLWRGLAKEGPVNAATNFRFLFKKDFGFVFQKYDRSHTIKGILLYLVTFAALFYWHIDRSWAALVVAFISGGVFSLHDESFAPGTKIKTVEFKSARKKKNGQANGVFAVPLEEIPYEYLYRLGMHAGARRVVNSLVKPKVGGFGFLFILLFPLGFLLLRAFTDAIPYIVLLYVEMAAVICILFIMSVYELFNLKIFYPAAVREFIPSAHLRSALYFYTLWLLLFGCIAAHFWTQNFYLLLGAGAIIVVLIVSGVRLLKARNHRAKEDLKTGDAEKKERLVAYLKANALTPAPSSANAEA